MDSAQEGASRRVGTCWHNHQEHLTSKVKVEQTPALSKSMEGATDSAHTTQTLHQIIISSKWPLISSQNTHNSGTSRWRVDSVANGKIPPLRIRMT